MTQPALGEQIVELEGLLDLPDSIRRQRRWKPHRPVKLFIRGCQDSQTVLERPVRLAKAAQGEIQPVFTIGHSPYQIP